MASYETKTFKGTMKYLKLSPQAKKSNFLEINCSHYQATVLIALTRIPDTLGPLTNKDPRSTENPNKLAPPIQ